MFVIRLRDPRSLPNPPFIYSRLFNAHAHTHDGSKFEQTRGSRALTTLPRVGSTATVAVHLVSMNKKFVLLVKGVPVQDSGEDELHVISSKFPLASICLVTSSHLRNRSGQVNYGHASGSPGTNTSVSTSLGGLEIHLWSESRFRRYMESPSEDQPPQDVPERLDRLCQRRITAKNSSTQYYRAADLVKYNNCYKLVALCRTGGEIHNGRDVAERLRRE